VLDNRLDDAIEDPCLTCNRIATKEMAATWCEHEDPRDECPDCCGGQGMSGDGRVAVMARGRTERETCELNGWDVGTVLRGHEKWRGGTGMWSTIRITAIGEQSILARCIRHEETAPAGIVSDHQCDHREAMWTLTSREWSPAPATDDVEREVAAGPVVMVDVSHDSGGVCGCPPGRHAAPAPVPPVAEGKA
jgi:hypothetical protein